MRLPQVHPQGTADESFPRRAQCEWYKPRGAIRLLQGLQVHEQPGSVPGVRRAYVPRDMSSKLTNCNLSIYLN